MNSFEKTYRTFYDIPPEIVEHIATYLPIQSTVSWGSSCKHFAAIIFNEHSGVWRQAFHLLGISYQEEPKRKDLFTRITSKISRSKTKTSQVNYRLYFCKALQQATEKGMDDFFEGSQSAINFRKELGCKPSKISIEKILSRLNKASDKETLDTKTFESLLTPTMEYLDAAQLRILYANALTTMPVSTLKKMLEIRPIPIKNDPKLQNFIRLRQPEYRDYLA